MQSNEVINLLSQKGRDDLKASSQWINPIPDDALALMTKIDNAVSIVKFSQSRRAEEGAKAESHHYECLIRLRDEIKIILNKS